MTTEKNEESSVSIPRWILQLILGVLFTSLIAGQVNLFQRVRAAETIQAEQKVKMEASVDTAKKQFDAIEKRLDRIESKIDNLDIR